MTNCLKVDGIYDLRTMKSLLETGVTHFSFDFRPKSFNFLQHYKFKEIYNQHKGRLINFYLKFSDEKIFVIDNIVKDLATGNVTLEFTDNRGVEFYDKFERDFWWHYRSDVLLHTMLSSENLKGIVLSFSFLEDLHKKNNLQNFVTNFLTQLSSKEVLLILEMDWDSNIFPSLFEYFDFDFVSLAINTKVESCYRNVDLSSVEVGLTKCKMLLD